MKSITMSLASLRKTDIKAFRFLLQVWGGKITLLSLSCSKPSGEDNRKCTVPRSSLVGNITANFDQKLATWESKRVQFKKAIENLAVPAVENLLGKYFEPLFL